jgi:hypothetical protein
MRLLDYKFFTMEKNLILPQQEEMLKAQIERYRSMHLAGWNSLYRIFRDEKVRAEFLQNIEDAACTRHIAEAIQLAMLTAPLLTQREAKSKEFLEVIICFSNIPNLKVPTLRSAIRTTLGI